MPIQPSDATVAPPIHHHPHWMKLRSALRKIRNDERGSGTVELVIATPALLLLILLIAQFALYMHATHIAQSAASQALSATRVEGGSAAAGNAEAQRVLSQLGSGPLQESSVNARRGATTASVTISGTATTILPFITLTVHVEAAGPVDKFIASRGEAG
jgi:Flp pilus assembly protein TadG